MKTVILAGGAGTRLAEETGSRPKPTVAQTDLPYTEEVPLQGSHPYDVSKSCADLIGQTYAASYGMPVAVKRCANIYGGGDLNWSRIMPGTIRSILRGERPVISRTAALSRDYLYVMQLVPTCSCPRVWPSTARSWERKGAPGDLRERVGRYVE